MLKYHHLYLSLLYITWIFTNMSTFTIYQVITVWICIIYYIFNSSADHGMMQI